MHASRNLRLIRLYYFLWIGAGGFLFPFVTLFYKDRGLSGSEIGLLSALGAVAGMLSAPLWGRRGDASRHPRRLLALALFGSACFALLRGMQAVFWALALFVVLEALVGSGTGSLSNMQALAAADGRKSGFGSIRLWGSLGWAAAAPLAGWLIERLGLYVPFGGYAVMLFASLAVLLFVRGAADPPPAGPRPVRPSTRRVLAGLLNRRAVLGLALAFVIVWLAGTGRQQFETLYMAQLGAQAGLIGLANTAGALVEVPFMLLADRLIRRHGSGRVLRAALLLQATAYLPVVLLPSIASIFALRILFSIAFSLLVVSYIQYLVENAPEGQGGTAISLFEVTLHGGVGLLAAPLAGFLFDLLGAYWLYPIGLGGSLLAWSILLATTRPRPAPAV